MRTGAALESHHPQHPIYMQLVPLHIEDGAEREAERCLKVTDVQKTQDATCWIGVLMSMHVSHVWEEETDSEVPAAVSGNKTHSCNQCKLPTKEADGPQRKKGDATIAQREQSA